ncbi:protein-L-isoaspartate O-methyltransferase [Pseudorhizobium endolithicum]|uniref:Protein-L-isoaspartate O-methyltransferase n=1 Tax=Pseudorhizobium endolithicum TaxID=1191678 RepID=A0ABM8PT01_9HYPH|nr:protein-L-isoaspartate O-methyltransferase [Pseudorhizobium endolithicum]CAD6416495.1 protein-L-isoaspartate O-methyltransferase [Rhizobium sp. Q54]CAD7046739.1 protein-L-isoaspartate O-methyltransferase [Pseudorhizobium endolithicum]
MMDFESARTKMVDNQIRTTDVTSHSVLQAFLSVPREEFVPANLKPIAYIDDDIEIAPGRYLMEASPLAKLLQLAHIGKDDLVLEVGCGTGYVSALLSQLAGSVVSLDADEDLCARASDVLSRLGYDNVAVVHGEMEKGYPAEAPYDLIFVNGAVEEVPAELLEQLRDGGRLVAVVGYGNAAQARLLVKERGTVSEGSHFNASVKPLPGFRRERSFVF